MHNSCFCNLPLLKAAYAIFNRHVMTDNVRVRL